MRGLRRLPVLFAVATVAGCGNQLGSGGGAVYGNPNDIISPPLVSTVCLGTDKGAPIQAGPAPTTPVLGYTGDQVAATGTWLSGYGQVLFRANQAGWVPAAATHPFYRPGFSTVRCSVAGIRPDGTPVFLYR